MSARTRDTAINPSRSNHIPGYFLSLKWKVLSLSSMVLIGVTLALTYLSYRNLEQQHIHQRESDYQETVYQLEGLVDLSAQRLIQLGGLIPSLKAMEDSLLASDPEQLRGAFNIHWPTLQLEENLKIVQFYSHDNALILSWSDSPMAESAPRSAAGVISYVNEREHPFSTIECNIDCVQYAMVPILVNGQSLGTVLLGKSLADLILGFKQVVGTDISLLVHNEIAALSDATALARWIPEWEVHTPALTSPTHTLPVLRKGAKLDDSFAEALGGLQVGLGQRDFEIRRIPLSDFITSGNADLMVVSDVTEQLAQIRADTTQVFVIAFLGLVLAEGLLLSLMWSPMSRLRQTSMSLPLLSERRFEDARKQVASREHILVNDETDLLADTTFQLAHQLETLEDEGSRHAHALAQRASELAVQKDFVSSLLDTAQAIIMTQNSLGEITMINQYGEDLLGYSEEELLGRPFAQIIAENGLTTDVYRDLSDLTAGRTDRLQQELSIRSRNGDTRYISWHHSRPPRQIDRASAVLSVGHDITDRKEAESQLAWLAEHDPLCGLFNRRRFQSELERAIATAVEHEHSGALLFLDLDQFKDVNDSSGHQAGDALLNDVAEVLSELVHDRDLIARIGGDEFAIVIRECSADGAVDMARKIENGLNRITFPVRGRLHRVTASIGIALFPEHGITMEEVLANADLAMYQAKDNGRGAWHTFSKTEQAKERVEQRVYWRARLEQAIAEDHFLLHFQPIVDIKRDKVTHFEILVRLRNEDNTIVFPGAFIGVAESTGLIHPLDRLVVKKAVNQLAALNRDGHRVNFSINLSAHAFSDPQLFDELRALIAHADIDPSQLIFEVTETAAVADFAAARKCITSIKEVGCRFALDDFGVGFSSFFSLKQLPVDYVKIDGSFIKNMAENHDDQLLVQALSQVAQGFGKQTIAEFVDQQDTLTLLRVYGIDYAQGYLLGKPQPAAEAFKRFYEAGGRRQKG